MKRLRRENAELKRANAILKAASAFFAAELDRPQPVIVAFVRDHQGHRDGGGLRWGVESICTVLTEHGCRSPRRPTTSIGQDADRPRSSATSELAVEIARVHAENFGVYGARKVWLQLNREGIVVARCTVERLMRRDGLHGAVRGRAKRTTIADPAAERARDLVGRDFAPLAPDRLWVADLTYVLAPGPGWVYVAFVVDAYARRILGWRTATTMTTSIVLDAARAGHLDPRPGPAWSTWPDWSTTTTAASQGGFKWSSQHLMRRGVYVVSEEGVLRWSSAAGCGPGDPAPVAVPGPAAAVSGCGAGVLAVDRPGRLQRGRRGRGGRVAAGGFAVVPPRWRHATDQPDRAYGPVPVVRRA